MTPALVFPFNADSQAIGTVTVRSRIRLVGGEPVALKKEFETAVVQGTGWEEHVAVSGKQLFDRDRAASFEVSIGKPLTLARCRELIVPRRPVKIRVTLYPDVTMAAPGMPVPVSAPVPPTSELSIAIPPVTPGAIELESVPLPDDASGNPRSALRARVRFAPFLDPTPDEQRAVEGTISYSERSGSSAVTPGARKPAGDGWVEKEYTAVTDAETMENATVSVQVMAEVCGITLQALTQLSFSPRITYQPYIVPKTVKVRRDLPASFTATIRAVDSRGNETPVPEATITVTTPSDIIRIDPESGKGSLDATVTQVRSSSATSLTCPVEFRVGKENYQDSVAVELGARLSWALEIGFAPPEKTALNPFGKGDTVTLMARVRRTDAEAPVNPQEQTPLITFTRAEGSAWLDEPSSVTILEGWNAVNIGATPPDPESRTIPPPTELVMVRAMDGSEMVVGETVAITLLSPGLLDAVPDTVRLLARAESDEGRKSGKSEQKVVLTMRGASAADWDFSLTPDEETASFVRVEGPVSEGEKAIFTVGVGEDLPDPDAKVGPASREQTCILHSRAERGGAAVDGPDVRVILLSEGLFVEKIFAVNEQNEYKTNEKMTVLPIRVDTPAEDRRRTARVKLVALVWDGNNLVEDEKCVDDEHLVWEQPVSEAGDSRKWETVFSTLKARVEYTNKDEPAVTPYTDLFRTWGISLDRVVPGAGENLQGEIRVSSPAGDAVIPLVLRFGELRDAKTLEKERERERCLRIIEGCIPKDRRQPLRDDLEKLPGKGANDYRIFSKSVYETAYRIWAEDQKDYEYWENGWGYYLLKGAEGAKWAGDVSFTLLIGYATASLGPAYSYGVSTMASEFKDQGLEFYAYYVEQGGGKPFSTCIVDFVQERLAGFLISLASGGVDMGILQGIDIKNPRTYTRLAWLWLWKFEQQLARDPEAGIVEAMINAGEEVAITASTMLLQEFVNIHGNQKLRDLHSSVKKKGVLGGKAPHGEEGQESEKPTKDKPKETEKTKKEKPGEKEKQGDKEKSPKEEKPKEKEKPGEKEKTGEKEKSPKEKPGEKEKSQKDLYKDQIKAEKEKAQKDADDYIARGKEFVDPEAKRAFEEGRAAGKKKVDELAKAAEELRKNPQDGEARRKFGDLAEEVQKDKHAMHELNDQTPGKQDPVREQFNEYWKGKYAKVDKAVKERIADDLNKNLKPGEKPYTADDIEVAGVTNTPPKSPAEDSVKSTYDRDVTYRDKRTGNDIKTKVSEKIYNEEFYKERHQGELPYKTENGKQVVDHGKIKEYAEHCDQTVTDQYHADAYGGGKQDIPPAVDPRYKGKPFKDVEATSKAMEYKVQEWYNRAEKAEKSGDRATAEAYREEGMRQLTKQFKNQIEARADKINEITGYRTPPVAKVPENLRAAVDIMNRVGTKGPDGKVFTAADAEASLRQMRTTPKEVVSKMSAEIESLQKHTPPEVRDAVEKHVSTLTDEAKAQQDSQDRFTSLKDRLRKKHGG